MPDPCYCEKFAIAIASQSMHAPDGFLNTGTAVATAAISAGTVGIALRQAKAKISEKLIPLAGITAAFIFAAQMFNFPVAAGTTGHLIGGAMAAILLGPHLGALVVAVVVVVQALVFADGGLTALGYNVLNMAVIPAYGGFALFTLFRRLMPSTGGGVIAATGLAAWSTVVLSAAAFSVEWLFGATAPVPFTQVFSAMVAVHVLIGVGEAVISALAVGAVLSARSDLVYGAGDLGVAAVADRARVSTRIVVIGGLLAALSFAAIISQFTFDDPDGLESVAGDQGFIGSGEEHSLADTLFSDYATTGIGNRALSLAIAGVVGTLTTLLVAWGLVLAIQRKGPRRAGA
jgi:cobalt/nickel transport system permease protein